MRGGSNAVSHVSGAERGLRRLSGGDDLEARPGSGSRIGSRTRSSIAGGTGWALGHSSDNAQDPFCKFGMLPNQFPLECVTLLTAHRRNVERIIRDGDVLNSLLRPAMNPGDPGVRGPVRAVRVIRSNPG
jgi:hypothetical protein